MIETRLLKYFLAIAREQSITRAAESLFLSQPTLSRQMKELEDALGVQLFVRGKRQTLLTEEGVYLRARAQEVMCLMEKTETTLKNSGSVIAGDIYAGFGESPSVALLMEVYGELQREHPDIHLHIYSGNAENIFERMDKGILDIGLLLGVERQDKYDYIDLPDADAFGVLMPKDHPLAGAEAYPLKECANDRFIMPALGCDDDVTALFAKNGIVPNVQFTTLESFSVMSMVEQGLGMSVMNQLITEKRICDVVKLPLDPPSQITLGIALHSKADISPAVRMFLKYAVRMLTKKAEP